MRRSPRIPTRSQRDPLPRQAPPVEHYEGGIALRCARCLGDQEVEDEPTAVLHEDVSGIGEARLLAPALAREERFGVGPGDMRLVPPPLSVEVHLRVFAPAARWRVLAVAWAHALLRGPGLQQRPIDAEVAIADQPSLARLPYDLAKASSVMFSPRNHLKRRSYWSRSQNCRSERME